MVTAIILLQIDRDKINAVAEQMADMEGISEVYSVSGHFDAVAIARVRNNDALSDLVTNHLLKIPGIQKTETLLAFRAYSRHDLETMFSIGIEGA